MNAARSPLSAKGAPQRTYPLQPRAQVLSLPTNIEHRRVGPLPKAAYVRCRNSVLAQPSVVLGRPGSVGEGAADSVQAPERH